MAAKHHPVAPTESDLVKLCHEFETLQRDIADQKTELTSSVDFILAAEIEYNMIRARHHGIIESVERTTRVLEAKLAGVKQLMNKIIGPSYNTDGAQAIDSIRRR